MTKLAENPADSIHRQGAVPETWAKSLRQSSTSLELISEGVAKKILALPMEPWQFDESRAVREKIVDRYA